MSEQGPPPPPIAFPPQVGLSVRTGLDDASEIAWIGLRRFADRMATLSRTDADPIDTRPDLFWGPVA